MQTPSHGFIVGHDYSRQEDIHAVYGGNGQSGISNSSQNPYIFLFTGGAGLAHGYGDRWEEESFIYFGEGQVGDMVMARGNRAILEHAQQGKTLLLFQSLGKSKPVRFIGEFAYRSYDLVLAPDREGNLRQAIAFRLYPQGVEVEDDLLQDQPSQPLDVLRLKAYAPIPSNAPAMRLAVIRQRRGDVKAYALERAGGYCECCGVKAPFLTRREKPYLEVHHIQRLSDYGLDRPDNVAAVTPNCHRRIHQSTEGPEIDAKLAKAILAKEEMVSKSK